MNHTHMRTDNRQSFDGRMPRRGMLIGALLAILLFLAGCAGPSPATTTDATTGDNADSTSIALSELPDELGRGFPAVELDGVDNADTGLQPGDRAPNFQLVLEDGRTLSLHDLHGQPVMLNFWATWCGPCRVEMPDIVELHESNDELVVVAVNQMEEQDKIVGFVEEFQMSMPVAVDKNGEMRRLYEIRGMPTSIFIDRDGRIDTVWSGPLTADKLQEFAAKIL